MPQVCITLSTSRTYSRGSASHAGDRIDRAVGQRRGHHRQVAAGRPGPSTAAGTARASPRRRRSSMPSERIRYAVARLRSALRISASNVAGSTTSSPLPAHATQHVEHALERARRGRAPDQAGRRQRAGVDHGVERAVVVLVEDQRVERVAAGLDPHVPQDVLPAVVGEGQRVGEDLRDRLQRERDVPVPGVVHPAVHQGHTNPEAVPLDIRTRAALFGRVEAHDVLGGNREVAAVQVRELVVDLRGGHRPRHRRPVGAAGGVVRCSE